MSTFFTAASLILPLVQLYLVFRIYKNLQLMADVEDRRKELTEMVRKFGAMFAEAADLPKKKIVSFAARADEDDD